MSGGFGAFTTWGLVSNGPGAVRRWESRRLRKHPASAARVGSTWWAPRARGWWIGVLFAVGSVLFALGAFPPYAAVVGVAADSVTYAVGSVFFTVAGFLQYREAVDSVPLASGRRRRRVFVFRPDRIEWLATAIQLAGTLFFNRSTFSACQADITAQAARHTVWRPDALGSICFLVASLLAWWEVCHGWAAWRPRQVDWWITFVNLAGSVAFGVSAVAAYVVPATGDLRDAELANLGTFVGAVGFLVGAILLLKERTEDVDPATGPAPST
jgi:hypothetical protein